MHHLIRTKQKHTLNQTCLSKDVVQLDRDIGFLSAPCPGPGVPPIGQILCILWKWYNRDWSCEDLILSHFMICYACPNPNISWYFPHSAGSSWTQLDLWHFSNLCECINPCWFCNKWCLLHQDQPAQHTRPELPRCKRERGPGRESDQVKTELELTIIHPWCHIWIISGSGKTRCQNHLTAQILAGLRQR